MPRLSRIYFPVTSLGPGRRLGLWFQGCSIGCAGCIAQDTWDPELGNFVEIDEIVRIWRAALVAGAQGVTISGGEPADQPAALVAVLIALRRAAEEPVPRREEEIDALVYTGYELTEWLAKVPSGDRLVDALITGPYKAGRPTRKIWRGSANQEMHLLSELGRRRYEPFRDHKPDGPPVQVLLDDHDISYVGVPRSGDMVRLHRRLRAQGLTSERVSWRS